MHRRNTRFCFQSGITGLMLWRFKHAIERARARPATQGVPLSTTRWTRWHGSTLVLERRRTRAPLKRIVPHGLNSEIVHSTVTPCFGALPKLDTGQAAPLLGCCRNI